MDGPLSVKRFLEQVKAHAEPRFANACLAGEVSNFRSSGRHWYFTLKEEGAALACAVWMSQQRRLQHSPKDGERVVVKGSLNVYVQGGSFTLAVAQCELAGIGDLQQRLRELEAALRSEGIFDGPAQELPLRPKKIAVIAALGGAALQDVLEVALRRAPNIDILVFPAAAQGDACVTENLMALQEAQDEYWGCDIILMVRGGGSLENLWGYNDPGLVRAVSECRLPIISGVGHEIDVTLVDLAADRRAATPSQAAEMAVPDRRALLSDICRKAERLQMLMDWRLQGTETTLNLLADQGLARLDPLGHRQDSLVRSLLRLERAAPTRQLDGAGVRLALLGQRLRHAGSNMMDSGASIKVGGCAGRLGAAIWRIFGQRGHRLGVAAAQLKGLHPESPLDRGFALVSDASGRHLKASAGIAPRDKLSLRFKDGAKWVVAD